METQLKDNNKREFISESAEWISSAKTSKSATVRTRTITNHVLNSNHTHNKWEIINAVYDLVK